jgi:hypothetical protein
MTITIDYNEGNSHVDLEVELNHTIGMVKSQLQMHDRVAIPVKQLKLRRKGPIHEFEDLEDGATLGALAIGHRGHLLLLFRGRGGAAGAGTTKPTKRGLVMKKLESLRGARPATVMTDVLMKTACKSAKKMMDVSTIDYGTVLDTMSIDAVNECIEMFKHGKQQTDRKIVEMHACSADFKAVSCAMAYFESAQAKYMEAMGDGFLLHFAKDDGSIPVSAVLSELTTQLRLKEERLKEPTLKETGTSSTALMMADCDVLMG